MNRTKKYMCVFCLVSILFVTFSYSPEVFATCGLNPKTKKETKTKVEKERLFTPTSSAEDDIILIPNEDWVEENIKEKSKESTKAKVNARWLENLKLRDFVLTKELLELDKDKLRNYRIDLEKKYISTPDVFSIAVSYGLLLIDLGETERAKSLWDRAALEDFPANPTSKVYKAWVDALKGNYLEAKNTWYEIAKEKIDLGISGHKAGVWLPYHIDAVLGLYLIKDYLPEKDKKEAGEAALEIAKHFGKNPKFASILVINDLNNGNLVEAAEKLDNLLKIAPDNPTVITLLGIAQLVSGNLDLALQVLEDANKLYPNSPTNHLMRARALYATNKKNEALSLFDSALKLEPSLAAYTKKSKKLLAKEAYVQLPKLEKSEGSKKLLGKL